MHTQAPGDRRRDRGWVLGLIAAVGLGLAACNHRLPRLSARGEHAEVVERAAQARFRPKGKAARAWAHSLAALGRVEEARAVLLRDFRVGADLRSLVALADLELRDGLRGLAAAHYARAASLEVDVLRGRNDVCALFRDRAERFLAAGEALAADLDMRRMAIVCAPGTGPDAAAVQRADRALHLRVTAAAKAQARAQRTLAGCERGACEAAGADEATRELNAGVSAARERGHAALRAAAARLGVQLAARDVADLLAAELRGELGLDIVTHDELRAWIGETPPAAIHAAAGVLPPVEQTYARLRLAQLGPDYALPGGDEARSTASLVVKLLEQFDADPSAAAMSWRVFVLVGDLASAELALTAGLGVGNGPPAPAEPPRLLAPAEADGPGRKDSKAGPVRKDRETAPGRKDSKAEPGRKASKAEPGRKDSSAGPASPTGEGAPRTDAPPASRSTFTPSQTRVPVPTLWSARRRVDPGSLPKLLLLARLRALGGHDDQALEIVVFALAEAHAQGLPGAEALAAAEGRRYLAAGQPWAALAVAGAVPGAASADLTHAAGAALVLARATCEGACAGADAPRDRIAVRQVFGEPWLLAQEARAEELALARPLAPRPVAGCPDLGELLAPDARGPLAAALAQVRGELTHRVPRARSGATNLPEGTGPKGQPSPSPGPAAAARGAARGPTDPLEGTGPKGQPSPSPLPVAKAPSGAAPDGAGEALRRAVEADPTLACAGSYAAPLFHAGDHRVAATALADELAHAPQEIASNVLALQSELALGLGRREQAEQLLIAAAAAASDPRAVWLRAIRLGALVDARYYELLALRQGLLHIPARDAAPLRLALVVRSLRDANDAWAARESDVGRETLIRGVTSYLEGEPPARRWQAREDLANALAAYPWTDLKAALLLRAALWPEPGLQRLHPAAAARLERALGGVADPPSGSPLAPAELAAALAAPGGPAPELSATAQAFVPVDQLQSVRLEIARRHPDPLERRRLAIALATTGDPATRVAALHLLLAELGRSEPARRDAVADLLLTGLAAVGAGVEPMVARPDDLLTLVFGLEREPARARPERKGD